MKELFDPDGEDPIPSKFISGEEFIAQFYGIEQGLDTWSVQGAINAWNQQEFKDRDLYLAVDPSRNFNKWNTLDVKHFMKLLQIAYTDRLAAEMTFIGPATTSADAHFLGILSEFRHLSDAPGSFMDGEDPSSNMAGIDLSVMLKENMAFSTQLSLFFDAIGIVKYRNGTFRNHIYWIEHLRQHGETFSEY